MKVKYDEYYQTENLFSNPYPELIEYFDYLSDKGSILDLGCGQGRNAIALARMGFSVTGVDLSSVGIKQMNHVALAEGLKIESSVADVFSFTSIDNYDIVLLDSMFHFSKKDRVKEIEFIRTIFSTIKTGAQVVFCIQDSGNKVKTLSNVINETKSITQLIEKKFNYTFKNNQTAHLSETAYRLIVVKR